MTITYLIGREVPTGLRVKSVFVQVKNDSPTVAYREAEVIMPLDEDADAWVTARYTEAELWAMGADAGEGAYIAAEEQPLVVPIYQPIIRQMFDALSGPADLDVIRSQLIALLQQNPATYNKLLAALGKLGVPLVDLTTEDKREQLLWVFLFALAAAWNAEAE